VSNSVFPTFSLTELQNARGIMDVLAEMLTAIDPEKKEVKSFTVIVLELCVCIYQCGSSMTLS
jgi:hypothetical protein